MIRSIQVPQIFSFELATQESPHFGAVKKIFSETISQDYGNQGFNLERFKSGNSRRCEVLLKGERLCGVIAYITPLRNDYGLKNSFEVRNLMMVDEENDLKKNSIMDKLFQRVYKLAEERQAESIHFPLPNSDKSLIHYLKERRYTSKPNDDPIKQSILYRMIVPQIDQTSQIQENSLGKRRLEFKETPPNKYSKSKEEQQVRNFSTSDSRPQTPSKHHSVTLKKNYIQQIRNLEKTIEGRINSGMMKNFKEGDTIRFFYYSNANDDVTCKITKITPYASFPDMLTDCGYKKCLPKSPSIQQAIKEYDAIPNYRERARQNGVLAIHLEVINKN